MNIFNIDRYLNYFGKYVEFKIRKMANYNDFINISFDLIFKQGRNPGRIYSAKLVSQLCIRIYCLISFMVLDIVLL